MTHNHHEFKSKSGFESVERHPATDLSWTLRKTAEDHHAKQRLTRPTETKYGHQTGRVLLSDPHNDRAWIMLTGGSDDRVEIRR